MKYPYERYNSPLPYNATRIDDEGQSTGTTGLIDNENKG